MRTQSLLLTLPVVLATMLLLGLTGCDPDSSSSVETTTVKINVDLVWDGTPVSSSQTVLDSQGRALQLERFEGYLSDFALHDVEEGWIDIDTIARVNFLKAGSRVGLDIAGESDRLIDGVRIGLGVPAVRNQKSGEFIHPSYHPLGYNGSLGMIWSWADGYIFSAMDLRFQDSLIGAFSYHPGQDTCFRSVDILWDGPVYVPKESQDVTLHLQLDAYKCLHGDNDIIDPVVDGSAHGGNLPLALRWVDLYQDAWALAP